MILWFKKIKFEKIVQDNLDSLVQLAYMKCKNKELAEDLVQEVCIKAYQSFLRKESNNEELVNPKAWLFKILINTHIDFVRKKQLETIEIDSLDVEDKKDSIRSVETSLFFKDLNKALDKLDPNQRIVVYLADINEYSYTEISNLLDIPIGTVTSRLYRARQALRKLLTESGYSKEYANVSE